MRDPVLLEPIPQLFQIRHISPELPGFGAWFRVQRTDHDAHRQPLLADINAGTSLNRCLYHVCSPCWTGEQMTSIGLTSSSARLLHSWVLHVILASFVCGTTYAPLPNSAVLTSTLPY